MNQKLGMAEFFAMEAGEYLERLDALVSTAGVPDPHELQRLTRALRGAALMANQQPIAQTSSALEQVARAVREGQRPWDDAVRQLVTRTVDDLKIFVRQVRNWTPADTEKAHALAAELEALAGRAARRVSAPVGQPDSGTRAFVAREGATLASALDRAAKSLAQDPSADEPLEAVLNVMQPLRGLASLADLPPMPDLLQGIEWAVTESGRGPRQEAAGAFEAAAQALSQAAREIASEGKAAPDSALVRAFSERLGALMRLERTVPSIESLYYGDAGPHVVEQGAPPPEAPALGSVDLVSHGEHLRQVADALAAARTGTQRMFRVYGLADTLRVLEAGSGQPLAEAAAEFAGAVRRAIGHGSALTDPTGFGAHLREAGTTLAAAAQQPDEDLAARLRTVASDLAGPAPAAPAAPAAAAEPPDLAGSLLQYQRYVDALGLEGSSLEELLAGPPADPGAMTARAVASAAPAPAPAPGAAAAATGPVPIAELCYSGAAALRRAAGLRERVEATLAAGNDPADLIAEVFDLVQLGLGPHR